MYFYDSTATINITQRDWEPANNADADLWTADTLSGVTFGSDRIEPNVSGVYQISGNLTFSGTATDTIQLAFQIGAGVDSTHQSQVVIPAGGITTMSLTRTAFVAANADIKFRVQNLSGSNALTARSGSISLIRVD
jgi:polyisoprenoid-binding protein YceI